MKAYSFKNYSVFVNGIEITGWADGDDLISIKRSVDSASHKVGGDGKMLVNISPDRSGEIMFKLMVGADSNAYLMGLTAAQEAAGTFFVPLTVLVTDSYGSDNFNGSVGYIKRPSDTTRGIGTGAQEWSIVVEELDLAFGINAAISAISAISSITNLI